MCSYRRSAAFHQTSSLTKERCLNWAVTPQQAEGSKGRRGCWALPSRCQNSPHTSFFLLHASSGCPPLSPCVDSHHTPARKHRLTTHETHTHTCCMCVCSRWVWWIHLVICLCLEHCCDWVDDLCLVLCCVPFKIQNWKHGAVVTLHLKSMEATVCHWSHFLLICQY